LTITQLLDHLVVVSAPDRRVGATVFHRDTVAQEAVKRAVVADEVMLRRGEGLTRLYHRFHRPDERHPEIEHLRDLHAALDHAVLAAYGWSDLERPRNASSSRLPHDDAKVVEWLLS